MRQKRLNIGGLILVTALVSTASAETITIGKGSGILWEGMPFNETLSGPLADDGVAPQFALLAISLSQLGSCMGSNRLRNIGGYLAYPLAPGVGLIPRATGSSTYKRYDGTVQTLTGTVGLPDTRGTAGGVNVTSPSGYAWCLPSSMNIAYRFYDKYYNRTATLTGEWLIVADGTQRSTQVQVPLLSFYSLSAVPRGDRYVSILPSNITLRVSNLECTVNTPTVINFGPVVRKIQRGEELGAISYPIITTCGQQSDYINANINLQFRALTGLYANEPGKLALRQGGGYITGEINNGVTGNGACNATSGLPFNNTPVKVGSISNTENRKTFTNQVTWRLCSGGSSLPDGPVDASAEMLVTFN